MISLVSSLTEWDEDLRDPFEKQYATAHNMNLGQVSNNITDSK